MTVRGARAGLRGLVALALLGGLACAMPSMPISQRGERTAARPQAPPEYDFLVARESELEGRPAEALSAYRRALEKDPDSLLLHKKVAELLARQGQVAEALAFAERAHVLDPEDEGTRLFLGTLFRLRRDVAGAERMLLGPDGEPRNQDAAFVLYSVYGDVGQFDRALELAEWMVRQDPDNLRGHFALAGVLERLGRPGEAEAALRAALPAHPGSLAVYGALARARRERGDRDGEIEIHREALRANPHHHATLVALAQAQIEAGRADDARATLEEVVVRHPDDLRSAIRLGFLELEARRYDAAAARFERALQVNPEQHEIAYFLGVVRRRSGDLDGAVAVLDPIPPSHERYADARAQLAAIWEARGDAPRALQEAERALAHEPSRQLELYVASLRARTGDFAGAVAYLERLATTAPDDEEVVYNLGVVHGEIGDVEKALGYMRRVLEKNPDHAGALNYIGYTWAEQGTKLDEAEAMITRALELRPNDGYITDSLGWVYYMRARPLLENGQVEAGRALLERAILELERAAELTGGDPVISEHLGDAYLLLHDKRRALQRYEEALSLEPRNKAQPELKQKLERLRRELEGQ